MTVTEAFELLKAERTAHRTVMGWGRLNEKLGRYFEVRCIALQRLVSDLFMGADVANSLDSEKHHAGKFDKRGLGCNSDAVLLGHGDQ